VKVDIYTTRSGDTQESVARRMEVETLPLETFRVLNGLEPGQPLRAGEPVKILVKG
jgi:predicted Zn-dependent protease